MRKLKWILLLANVGILLAARQRRKPGAGEELTSSGENSLGDDADGSDKDIEPWLQRDVVTELQADYEANRHVLATLPEPHEIVYPVQVRKTSQLELDTRDYKSRHDNVHFHHTSLQLSMFGKRLKIKLELNKELLQRGLQQKRHVDASTQMITVSTVENCYYKGKVRRIPESLVVVSTCRGVSGIIQLHNESFVIKPLMPVTSGNQTRYPHVVYRAMPADGSVCGNERGMWHPFHDLHRSEFLKTMKILKTQQVDRDILQERKHMELALVSDRSMFKRFNYSYTEMLRYLIQLANTLDAYMGELEVQIELVLVDIWNLYDQMEVSVNTRHTLQNFMFYRQQTLKDIGHDIAHLVTGQRFSHNESGMAVPDSICSRRAVSVSYDPTPHDPQHGAATAAHYMAHTLGIKQDQDDCYCADSAACIMAKTVLTADMPAPHHFSSCSLRAMNSTLLAGLGSCLFQTPLDMTYPQECGNKLLERGEECDCGSADECAIRDPCCDPKSCLLRPWATCRSGTCCSNCTVLPPTHVCRSPLTDCDVPEFCSGDTGDCPANELVQDGEPCRHGNAFCYHGFCHTHADQCYALWGEGATEAVDKCYEKFNPTGNFNGHCGQDKTTGDHIKCNLPNIKCGLLHCDGGDKEPRISIQKTFTLTKVVSDGGTYQCKIVNSRSSSMPNVGMVADGTRCGPTSLCLNHTCVPASDVMTGTCPTGENNLTCSGNGLCTASVKCFCERGFSGPACGQRTNRTTTMWARPTTTPLPRDPGPTQPPATVHYVILTTTDPATVIAIRSGSVSTTWLIVVLAGVVGGGVLLFGASILCYRRQSPVRLKKAQKKKLFFNKFVPPVISSGKSDGSAASEDAPRLISFGNMPSYRADKIKEYQKKALRKSGGGASETGSEHSGASHRDGALELKVIQTLPLARPPDRGILKKFPRSADDLLELASSSVRGTSPRPAVLTHLHQLAGERHCLLKPTAMKDASTQGNTLEEGEYESLMSAQSGAESESSCDKKDDLTPSDDDSCCKPTPTPSPPDSGKEEGGKSDSSSGSKRSQHSKSGQGPAGRGDKTRSNRIKNIEDLIKQIDAQASSLAKPGSKEGLGPGKREPSLSPSNSEVEADRHCPRESFYHLSDCEEEKSPQNESPSHYMPKPMPRLQRQYNPLQVEIPQNVGPFSILNNPPPRSNLSPASRRFPSNSSSLTATTPGSPRDVYKTPTVAPLFSKSRTNSSASPTQPQLSPGALSTSSRLSSSSRLSNNSSTSINTRPQPLFSSSPLQGLSGRRQSPTNPFTGSSLQMRRSPELNLGAIPLQAMPSGPENGPIERQTPPRRPPERGSPSLGPRRNIFPGPGQTPDRRDPGVTKPSPLPRTTPVKPRMPSPKAGRKNSDHESSPVPSRTSSPRGQGSPVRSRSPQSGSDGQHPLTAIPYRGAKNIAPGSPPQNPNRSGESSSDPDTPKSSSPKSSSPKPPPRNPHYINKLTHPLLDGYPFKASHNSLTPDVASNSEGYHSDKAEPDDSIILREIPVLKPDDPQYSNHRRSAYKSGTSDSIDL